jgi:septal ring factor EnvC (AmiA/AmiB activator)
MGDKCPIGSHLHDDKCAPISRCPNDTHRTCQSIEVLKENVDRLKTRIPDNELLEHIVSDYENLYAKLKHQKSNQHRQMTRILHHLQQIQENNFLSNTGLRHIEFERERLLTTLQTIRDSVHTLAEK